MGEKQIKQNIEEGSDILKQLQRSLLGDPRFQGLSDLLLGEIQNPITLTPELIQSLKDTGRVTAQDKFKQTADDLASRFGQTSGIRSGPFAAALGQASSGLSNQIAQSDRQLDITAAESQNQDLNRLQNLIGQFFQLQNQIPSQEAQLLAGSAGALQGGPSLIGAAGSGLGSLLGVLLGGGALGGLFGEAPGAGIGGFPGLNFNNVFDPSVGPPTFGNGPQLPI